MANLYGTANAPGLPVYTQFVQGAALTLTHDVYTTIWTTPNLIAPSNGYFYALVWMTMVLTVGAVQPNGCNFACAIGAGTLGNFVSMNGLGFPVNAELVTTCMSFTPASQVAWQGAGSPVTVAVNPSAQSLTMQPFGSGFAVLMRAPDQ